jgi:hypothetical protein
MSPPESGSRSPFDPFGIAEEKKQEHNNAAGGSTSNSASASLPSIMSPGDAPPLSRTATPDDGMSLQSEASSLDPFGIASLTQQPSSFATKPGGGSRIGNTATATSPGKTKVAALPPKMLVKVTIYEEVTSVANILEPDSSRISVEGSVYVQLHSSDARRNAPFQLSPSSERELITIKPNSKYTRPSLPPHEQQQTTNTNNPPLTVTIPKNELGYVPVLYYSFDQMADHMPVLLERKVTIHEESCRIAFQVRSKLTNAGDLRDFTLAVAIPEKVDADSIEVLRGDGVYDGLQRLIRFKLAGLEKGESFMVSAQANLWKALGDDEDIHFPAVMRCSSSEDQISSVDFTAMEAAGQPSSLTVHKAHSFRLMHRLS